MGRSPEMLYGQRSGAPLRFVASSEGAARNVGSV
jgi:hypothetical protein